MAEIIDDKVNSLLRRAFMFLEDEEWDRADEYAEKILDIEPENPDAYLCKLLSEVRVSCKESLCDVPIDLAQNKNFSNAVKFADASLREFLLESSKKALTALSEQESARSKREKIDSRKNLINTYSDLIETYRGTQSFNRGMIKRGKSAAVMYAVTYCIFLTLLAVFVSGDILVASLSRDNRWMFFVPVTVGIVVCYILLWVAHARLKYFLDIEYQNERGWTMPIFFGMINVMFTFGIWGLVDTVKSLKVCKNFAANNKMMDEQIIDFQKKIKEEKATVDELSAE